MELPNWLIQLLLVPSSEETVTAQFISTIKTSHIPFFIYDDPVITMNGFNDGIICEYSQREDALIAKKFLSSSWRTFEPSEAKLFVILIPFHQSYFW